MNCCLVAAYSRYHSKSYLLFLYWREVLRKPPAREGSEHVPRRSDRAIKPRSRKAMAVGRSIPTSPSISGPCIIPRSPSTAVQNIHFQPPSQSQSRTPPPIIALLTRYSLQPSYPTTTFSRPPPWHPAPRNASSKSTKRSPPTHPKA